ncbi:putative exported protein [Granulibacter bethesdensis]|nr:putative exported protein [Granulibacter bethesdensis]
MQQYMARHLQWRNATRFLKETSFMRHALASILLASASILASGAAQTAQAAQAAKWTDSIKLDAQLDGGFVINGNTPDNGVNFGQLFTDRSNQATLNQAALTLHRDIDSTSKGYDFGFNLQLIYGSDVRYLPFLGEFNKMTSDRYKLVPLQANVAVHTPWLFNGGIDWKIGQYISPVGFETIDPATTPFYTHSYTFNFAVPFQHTGFLSVSHVSPMVDVYFGVNTGNFTTFAGGDNNSRPSGVFGFQFNNLMNGKLSVLALTNIGPEGASLALGPDVANSSLRFFDDIVIGYKATEKTTLTLELNYMRDEVMNAESFSTVGYFSHVFNDHWTFNARAEVFRDMDNFFIAGFKEANGGWKSIKGLSTPLITAPGPGTYGDLTLGVTWKPNLPKPIAGLMLRPEVRYDRSLNGAGSFVYSDTNPVGHNGQFLFAADAILQF